MPSRRTSLPVLLSIHFFARRDDSVGQVAGSEHDAGDSPERFAVCRFVGQPILAAAAFQAASPLFIVLIAALPISAQSFDAASIKPADPEHIGLQIYSPNPGSFRAMAADVKHLTAFAYNVRDIQVSGGPRWANTDLFDIEAKAPGPATTAELRLMVQSLLADRFHLKLHRESKEQAVFHLIVGKSGPKLTPMTSAGLGIGLGKNRLNGRGANMPGLASVLSSRVGSQVIDRTDLQGFYNFTLTWTPDEESASADAGPSIFTAIQEQLGLKLEPAKGSVEILVVDNVERLSGN